MLIAQITDTHIRAPGQLAFQGQVDTRARLRDAVAFLMALDPRPDVVLATGDLADTAAPAEYAVLAEVLRPLTMPVLAVPGNHDSREGVRAVFAEVARASGPFIQYVVDDFPLRLVALDTLQERRIGGLLCPQRLAWLREVLDTSTRPTLLFMHHPPFHFGAQPNADMACEGGDALQDMLDAHPNVVAVLCGHLHRSIVCSTGARTLWTLPATAPMLELNLTGAMPRGWIDSAPMLGLHLWRDGALLSQVVAVDEPARYTPFAPAP